MKVFKLYFKLLKKIVPTLSIYIGIFLLITTMFAFSMKNQGESIFEETQVKTAFINKDEDSVLLQGLKSYLSNSSKFIEIDHSMEGMQDSLFFQEVHYILTIPKGFTKDFLDGKDPQIKKHTIPDSTMNHNVDIAVNNFLNTARVYRNSLENISEKDLVKKIAQDLDVRVNVELHANELKQADHAFQAIYYNFFVYAILSVLILGISSIMISFTGLDIKRRNFASPIPFYSIQLQQILGHISFTLICVILFIVMGSILNRQLPFNQVSMLFILNMLSFAFAALSIAYLVGSLTKSKELTNGMANVLGLGMSFVSGVFVPIELLGETTIQIAKFTPAYWYTTTNSSIATISDFSWKNLAPLYGNMLIQLGFALAIFAVALVINKKKSTEAA